MKEFTIRVSYGSHEYDLKAVVEYETDQAMGIRVFGTRQSILLENDLPARISAGVKESTLHWKIQSGGFRSKDPAKDAQLMADILRRLEDHITSIR